MNIKARALAYIAMQKETQNFWSLLNRWKEQRRLPEEGFFSVLVYGLHKTFETELCRRFKLLWPQCSVTEGVQVGTGRMLYAAESAGYTLIIHTRRISRGLNIGLSYHWDVVEVEKNRFFEIEYVKMLDEVDGEPTSEWVPRRYDLVPIRPPIQL